MLGYADARGLSRHLQPVPVLTPTLSSYWVHLVTPIPSQIARPLIEGLRNETVVRDHSAHDLFPAIHPVGYCDGRPRRRGEPRHGRGGDELVRRAGDQRRRRAAARAHHPGGQAHRAPAGAGGGDAGRDVRRPVHHRRPARLPRLGLGLGAPRRRRPAGRRRGAAPRPPRPRRPARRRRPRLLARRGGRARPPAAPARRDEGAGRGLAPVRDASARRTARCSCRPRTSRREGCPGSPTGTRCSLSTAGYSRV